MEELGEKVARIEEKLSKSSNRISRKDRKPSQKLEDQTLPYNYMRSSEIELEDDTDLDSYNSESEDEFKIHLIALFAFIHDNWAHN